MKDKTKEQATNTLEELRQQLGGFEIFETGLKLAEDKLRESKVFTENLIACMKDGLFVLDNQGVHLDVNTALCQMTGFTREELIGTQPPHPYWPEESYEEMLTVLQKIREGEFEDYELTFKRKNGERFPVIVSPSQIGNKEENAVRYFATVKDITERKQAEVALRESEEKFSVAFRSSPNIIAITTIKDGRYVDINDNYCLATGYSREELIGRRTRDIGIWAREEDSDRMFGILEKEGKISDEEFDFRIKSGEVHTWRFSAEKIIVGGEDCLIGVAIDITEEKKRQQLQHGENYVLRLLGQAVELPEVLDAIARLGEEYDPGIRVSVMLVDSSHQLLKLAAAPSMPEEFSKVLENGLPIGPNIGTCGTAAYLKERVIVPDVTNSPLFASSEDVVRMGLLASFSQPIISSKGTVLGTIANYRNKVGEPSADTLRILEWSARVAAIAIEGKQAETALRESEAQYRTLIETALEGVCITNEEETITFANHAFAEMLGYEIEEVIGQNLRMLVSDEDWLKICAEAEKRRRGETSRYEVTLLGKEGIARSVFVSAAPFLGPDGRFLGSLGLIMDITERKRAEEALRESEATQRAVLDSATDAILSIDQFGNITLWNNGAKVIFGYTEKEIVGKPMAMLMPEKFRKAFSAGMEELCSSEYDYISGTTHEVTGLRKDGSEFPAEISIASGQIREGKFYTAVVRDITERKQAEEELRIAEQNFRNSLENSPLGVRIVSTKGELLYANQAILDIYGYSSVEELKTVPAKQRYTPESYTEHQARKEKRRLGKPVPPNYEISIRRKDGELRHLMVSRKPVVWDGEVQFQVIYQDITERKQAEEMYRTLANSSPVGVYIFQDAKYCFVNPEFQKLTGYSEDELLNMSPWQLVHPEDRARARENAVQMLKGNLVTPYEFRVIHGGGETHWAMETVSSIHYRGKRATLGNFMDITERKEIEESLQQSEEMFRMLFNNASDMMFLVEIDDDGKPGRILRVNDVACEKLGYSRDDLLSLGRRHIASPESWQHIISNITPKLLKTGVITFESELVCKDGHVLVTEHSVRLLSLRGKRVTLITARDITERKKLQEQLMLTDRLASIGQLASGIAHELNNPLTSVIGFSELLLERELPADIREDLGTINREANRTAQVVRGLLTFARKQGGEKALVDINDAIQGVLQLRSYEQKVRNIEVKTALAPDLPQVTGNVSQLEQVFVNIIINAEQAMLEVRDRGRLTITTERVGDIVRASFTDDGPGISPENMGRIFTPFFTTKEVGKGSGLGLAICHGVVTEHGGKIYANSDLGKGATFVVELPIKQVIKRRRRKTWKT